MAKIGQEEQESEGEGDICSTLCLVAVGRELPNLPLDPPNIHHNKLNNRPVQFISRHGLDGKFLYIDQR